MLKALARKILRKLLGNITKRILKKHKPQIILITGENNPSFLRELVYETVSQKTNARRNLERTESEFSIPLTVIGQLSYPRNMFSWILVLSRTFLQTIYIKPYKHTLVLQINFIDEKIFKYWLNILKPEIILNTNPDLEVFIDKNTTELIVLTDDEVREILQGSTTSGLLRFSEKLNINQATLNEALRTIPFPQARFRILKGKNESIVVDARYRYYPGNLASLIELTESIGGEKVFITKTKLQLPTGYTQTNNPKKIDPESDHVYVVYADINEYRKTLKKICVNEFEA